jgi:hypothetical protein
MTAKDLERLGVTLEPKLTFTSVAPIDADTLAWLRAHKAELLRNLTAPDSITRLPWQLERLVSAAGSDNLPTGTVTLAPGQFVPDLGRYTLAWAAAYLTGDRDEAQARLWQAYRAWQGVN